MPSILIQKVLPMQLIQSLFRAINDIHQFDMSNRHYVWSGESITNLIEQIRLVGKEKIVIKTHDFLTIIEKVANHREDQLLNEKHYPWQRQAISDSVENLGRKGQSEMRAHQSKDKEGIIEELSHSFKTIQGKLESLYRLLQSSTLSLNGVHTKIPESSNERIDILIKNQEQLSRKSDLIVQNQSHNFSQLQNSLKAEDDKNILKNHFKGMEKRQEERNSKLQADLQSKLRAIHSVISSTFTQAFQSYKKSSNSLLLGINQELNAISQMLQEEEVCSSSKDEKLSKQIEKIAKALDNLQENQTSQSRVNDLMRDNQLNFFRVQDLENKCKFLQEQNVRLTLHTQQITQVNSAQQQSLAHLESTLKEYEKKLEAKQSELKNANEAEREIRQQFSAQKHLHQQTYIHLAKATQQMIKLIFQVQNKAEEKFNLYETKIAKIISNVFKLSKLALSKKALTQIERNYDQYFQNDILLNRIADKQFLIDQIQKRYGPVSKTRLLFRQDSQLNTNFHKYFDYKANVMIIIRLNDQRYLAAFADFPFFKERKYNGRDSILLSLSNREVFLLKQGAKAINYDDYYIIFGNSEISIKCGEKKVFSNFGLSTGSYLSRGKTVDILFGRNQQNEVDLQYYQIYQLQFEGGSYEEYAAVKDLPTNALPLTAKSSIA